MREGASELVGIQECSLLAVEVGESEGHRYVWAEDLGIDIVGAVNDCRVSRLIGLARLDCQQEGMEVENAGECLPKARGSSRGRRWGSKRTSEEGQGDRDGTVEWAMAGGHT